jgi:acyl-CoA reductase-like NAD-dependent aldehyde dehydrogenase
VTGRRIVQASGQPEARAAGARRQGREHRVRGRHIVNAVNGSAFAIFHNQGQACIAGSRLMLHEKHRRSSSSITS